MHRRHNHEVEEEWRGDEVDPDTEPEQETHEAARPQPVWPVSLPHECSPSCRGGPWQPYRASSLLMRCSSVASRALACQPVLGRSWEPSSKTCSACGWLDEDLTLSDRIFHCEAYGLVLDRDLNAAINLAKLAGSLSDSLNACGADSAGSSREAGVQLSQLVAIDAARRSAS
jgi:hypothetical protein